MRALRASYCGLSFGELEPRLFSFNSPFGACPGCSGLGVKIEIDPWKVIPDRSKSIAQGAIVPWSKSIGTGKYPSMNPYYTQQVERVLRSRRVKITTPVDQLGRADLLQTVLYGAEKNRSSNTRRAAVTHGRTKRRSKAWSTTCNAVTTKRAATT